MNPTAYYSIHSRETVKRDWVKRMRRNIAHSLPLFGAVERDGGHGLFQRRHQLLVGHAALRGVGVALHMDHDAAVVGGVHIAVDGPGVAGLRVRFGLAVRGGIGFACGGLIRGIPGFAFGGFVRAQFLLSSVVFFILLAGFTLLGQRYALLLALLLAVMDFIPIIGAGTLLLPWAALCLLTQDSRRGVELLVIWGIIALFRRVAEPRVVGNQTGLSPILSLISIYVGMRLVGVPGMVLGPVVFLVVFNLVQAGVFDGIWEDLRLASREIRAILGKTSPSSFKN